MNATSVFPAPRMRLVHSCRTCPAVTLAHPTREEAIDPRHRGWRLVAGLLMCPACATANLAPRDAVH